MGVIKEWRCERCGRDFEGALSICPSCGKIAKRAFRTAPGYQSGLAKRCDRTLQYELSRRGITNFKNTGSRPSVTFQNEVSPGTHLYAESGQPVMATWGTQVPEQYTQATGLPAPVVPQINAKPVTVPAGAKVGSRHTGLTERTELAGRCDHNGNLIR
jgi:hypothetical protein